MKTPFPTIQVLALVLTGLLMPLQAADQATTWDIRVTAVDILPGQDTLWLRTGPGTKPVPVSLNIRTFSLPIRYKGLAKVFFFRNENEASLDEAPAPLATATLGEKSSLIVFSPNPDSTVYQTMVIGDSGFPFGSFRFFNGSGIDALADIDGKKLLLKHGRSETLTFREAKSALPVRIMTASEAGSPRLVRQSSWSIDISQRELVLLMPGSAKGLVTLRHFIDSKTE